MSERVYAAIDLKSFYASVECIERKIDPLGVHLVVADESRTQKTICLAVSPSLKAYGIPGRARLFEVQEAVRKINAERRQKAHGHRFTGKSHVDAELQADPSLELDFIVATPRMALYMDYSSRIYDIYLQYVAAEDMHVYSIDEVFLDLTDYLPLYRCTAHELVRRMIRSVLQQTGITATAGIGTNLYLCKVAMDIMAKHTAPDSDGVRIAELDELSYRKNLWSHTPITDFWRVGRGYAAKLREHGILTMGDIARCSTVPAGAWSEALLYDLFGVNAELLIDHAWGVEPCTMADVHTYKPQSNSLGQGQVLACPYEHEKTRLVVKEMADMLASDLVAKGVTTDQIVLDIGYDVTNLTESARRSGYVGEVVSDRYGRKIPKHAHGTTHLKQRCASTRIIMEATLQLFDEIADPKLLSRRLNITAMNVQSRSAPQTEPPQQLNFFTDYAEEAKRKEQEQAALEKERKVQNTLLSIQNKYGKNAIVMGIHLEEGATAMDRNGKIGGHKA